MKFTDRFIKVPVKVFNISHKDLTGEEILNDSYEMINPFEIASYRPSYGEDGEEDEAVNIIHKNGDKTLVYMSIKEFEKLLNRNSSNL